MENFNIRRLAVGLILISVVVLAVVGVVNAQSNQPVFRIGVLDDDTGSITNGARLAVEAINRLGGVQGADGTRFRLELVVQPTNNGANLVTAVANLNQASVIAVLGPETNAEALDGLPSLTGLNVPILTPAISDTLLNTDTSDRLFRIRAAEVWQGRALADFLINDFNFRRIATVQLDIDSTAGVIGFSTASSALGVQPQPALLLQSSTALPTIVGDLILASPDIVVAYGEPAAVVVLYNDLRTAGFSGLFAYYRADDPQFRGFVPANQLTGVIATTTWPYTAADANSEAFLISFVRFYGQVPDAVAASSYDAVNLLAAAIGLPGELQGNLLSLDNIPGVQGVLSPAQFDRGETTANVAVVQLNAFGAPEVLARYQGSQRLQLDTPGVPVVIGGTPLATATPAGNFVTITSARQNVRLGPSTQYDVIGQLLQGETALVIGGNTDLSWYVIDFRGQMGWLSASILDFSGDPASVPIIPAPPTPTPPPSSPTPTLAPDPDIVIDAAVSSPTPIIANQPFTVSVTVRNNGAGPAGQFIVAATFPPSNIFASAIVPGLGSGQTAVVNLAGTLANTGFYSVIITADQGNTVPEGNGEVNNNFTFSYAVDRPLISQGTQTLNGGDTIDLEDNAIQGDANFDGTNLDAIFGARIGVLNGVDFNTAHYDLVNTSTVGLEEIGGVQLVPGTVIGIITADGNRGVMRVDANANGQLTLTYRTYQTT